MLNWEYSCKVWLTLTLDVFKYSVMRPEDITDQRLTLTLDVFKLK